jgi:hypothetical protein
MTAHILDNLEKYYRTLPRPPVRPITLKEAILNVIFVLLCAPFLSAVFFVLPLIGQILVLCSFSITIWYFFARRSWLVVLSFLTGFFIFAIPTLATIQLIKNNLNLTLFFLLALGVPVSIFYICTMACRIWCEADKQLLNH